MKKAMRKNISRGLWLLPTCNSTSDRLVAARPEWSHVRRLVLNWLSAYGKKYTERVADDTRNGVGKENARLKRGVATFGDAFFDIGRIVPFETGRSVRERGVKMRKDVWLQRSFVLMRGKQLDRMKWFSAGLSSF